MKILHQKEGEECCYLIFKQKDQGEESNPRPQEPGFVQIKYLSTQGAR